MVLKTYLWSEYCPQIITDFIPILIKKVPRKTEAEDTAIGGIMGRKEILPAATATVDVTHHDKESSVLEMHVGIHIHKGITSYLHTGI